MLVDAVWNKFSAVSSAQQILSEGEILRRDVTLFTSMRQTFGLISLGMLNERIRALRLAKGLTLQQVGDVFGISRTSVSNWETGHSQPDPRKIERLAQLFDTSVQFLLSGAHTPAPIENESTFVGIPFVPFVAIKDANASICALCSQSQTFLPMSFGASSASTFCTDFPTSIDPLSMRLIPPGAFIFFDPELTIRNQAVVLARKIGLYADFFMADLSSSTLKLRSLTQKQSTPYTPEAQDEIVGVAKGYIIRINL